MQSISKGFWHGNEETRYNCFRHREGGTEIRVILCLKPNENIISILDL